MEGKEYSINVSGWIVKISVPTYDDAYIDIANFLTTAFQLASEAAHRMGLEERAQDYEIARDNVIESTDIITDELEDEINDAMEDIFNE